MPPESAIPAAAGVAENSAVFADLAQPQPRRAFLARLAAGLCGMRLAAESLVWAAEPNAPGLPVQAPAVPSQSELMTSLIAQLDHPDYFARESAEQKLLELGPETIPALRAVPHPSCEQSSRIKYIIACLQASPRAGWGEIKCNLLEQLRSHPVSRDLVSLGQLILANLTHDDWEQLQQQAQRLAQLAKEKESAINRLYKLPLFFASKSQRKQSDELIEQLAAVIEQILKIKGQAQGRYCEAISTLFEIDALPGLELHADEHSIEQEIETGHIGSVLTFHCADTHYEVCLTDLQLSLRVLESADSPSPQTFIELHPNSETALYPHARKNAHGLLRPVVLPDGTTIASLNTSVKVQPQITFSPGDACAIRLEIAHYQGTPTSYTPPPQSGVRVSAEIDWKTIGEFILPPGVVEDFAAAPLRE